MNRFVFAVAACVSLAASAEAQPLKVLMVGNSFSQSCMRHLPAVAKDCGVELDLVSACIGGCPLAKHWRNVTNEAQSAYGLDWARNGVRKAPWPELSRIACPRALTAILKADRWDIITIQQYSGDSWRPQTYRPYFKELYATFKKYAPQADVVVQETWSYAVNHGALAHWKIDNVRMYRDLHRAYCDIASEHALRVIPVGTAVQLWRERLPVDPKASDGGGDVVGPKDPQHLNASGDYLQALVWTAKLFGADVTKCAYAPADLAPEKAALMRRVAADAVRGALPSVACGGTALPAELAAKIEKVRATRVTDGEIVELDYRPGSLRVAYVLRPTPKSYIRCELGLPDPEKWDGRLWAYGNGGWAGKTSCYRSSARFATVQTDMGTSRHSVEENPCDIEVLRDFGWRSTHLMTVEAKKLIAAYYGKPPHHSYFTGCSTGGGQALCEVQRYPEDYDGVIAGVPGNDRLARATGVWREMRLREKDGTRFTKAQIATIRKAELDYFAKTDPEVARGRFIWNPKPTKEKLDGCWQAVLAADPSLAGHETHWRGLFEDVVIEGRRLEPGASIGLEFNPPWTFMLEKFSGPRSGGKDATAKDLLDFADNRDIRFVDPDISAFARRGGKLVTYAGFDDGCVPPRPVTEYFESVAKHFGGVEKAQEFMLHYEIPGRRHCVGGNRGATGAPDEINEKVIAWVEKGIRPDEVTVPFVESDEKPLKLRPYPYPNR